MYFVFNIWDTDRLSNIKKLCENIKNIDKIIILANLEANLHMMLDDLPTILQISQSNNIPLYVLTSGHKDNQDIKVNTECVIDIWDTFFFTITFYKMLTSLSKTTNDQQGLDICSDKLNLFDDFDNLYICLNKAPKLHRAILIDTLAQHDLLKKGKITWREISNYQFKYWKQELLYIDQTDNSKLFNQELLPPNYKNSFIQIVPESQDEIFFLTEKTAVPLFFGKPFLVAGSYGFHEKLESMGFKLYTEIFDYSFDKEKDLEKRYEGLVQNIKRYKDTHTNEFKKLYLKVIDKIVYNRNLAYNYAVDTTKFPKIWNELAIPDYIDLQPLNPYTINKACLKYHDKFIFRQI